MATGRLGAVKPAANTATALYTAPADTVGTVTVSVCNQGSSIDAIRLAVCSGGVGSLAATDYIEYELLLPNNTAMERTGVVVYGGQSVIVQSANGTCSFVAYGLEG